MTPHKDPDKLPVDDQLKLLRNTTDKIESGVVFQGFRELGNDLLELLYDNISP